MFRFPLLATYVPAVALDVLADAIDDWWDSWIDLWGLFDPAQRRDYLAEVRDLDERDAHLIGDGGGGNAFASDSGGDS